MGYDSDLLWGIAKPLKDAAGALGLYAVLSALTNISNAVTTINPDIGFSFNIWLFLPMFAIVSLFDDFASQIYGDFKKSYNEPIDQLIRIFGMAIGMVIFGGPLVLIYSISGGSMGEAIMSWVVSFIILIGTMYIRVKIGESNRRGY